MPVSRISIRSELIVWAMERSGLSPEDLEKKFPKLSQWESGELLPTLRQVEQFANTTRTPLGYLFLAAPPEERLPIPHFRTVTGKKSSRPSPDLLETVHVMQQRQAWMREYLIEERELPLEFPTSAKISDNPTDVARKIREVLGLGTQWAAQHPNWESALRGLQTSIENAGILVVANGVVGNNNSRKLDVEEFRGFVLTDDYAPLVFVNAADGKAAQMFTLVHEVAHIWFGSSAAFDLRQLQAAADPTEQACNKVAAEVLIPADELMGMWADVKSTPALYQSIARQFKVSTLVAARRAQDLGLIDTREFLRFYNSYLREEHKKKKSNGGDFYATQNLRIGPRFASTVVRATKEGKLLFHDAYNLTGLHGKTFDQFAAKLSDRSAA